MSLPAAADQDSGSMIAVKGDVEKVKGLLKDNDEVTIATSILLRRLCWPVPLRRFRPSSRNWGILDLSVYPLQFSAAFHTSFVKHAQEPFKLAIQKESFKKPKVAVYSNSTAGEHEKDPRKLPTDCKTIS